MVTDLPDPLSPTTPSSSPGAIEKLTPFTAWTAPSRVANTVRRSDTSRTGAGPSSIDEPPEDHCDTAPFCPVPLPRVAHFLH